MSDAHECGCVLRPALRDAIRRGWRGLAIAGDRPGLRLRLACVVCPADVEELAGAGLAVGLPATPAAAGTGGPRRVVLALVGDPSVALTLDLGFADARALIGRLGADAALELVWADAGTARPLRMDVVGLSLPTADRLRTEAALQGEWRTHDPAPHGFSALEWAHESAWGGPARLARGGRRGARVVVVAPVGAAPPSPAGGRPDLELGFPAGPPVPEGSDGIRLWFHDARQRALARALHDQESVAILLVDGDGRRLAQLDLGLSDDSRVLIADAVRASARRAEGRRTGMRARPRDGGR